MSLFSNPTEHAANPPESWVVVKRGRRWDLEPSGGGGVIQSFEHKRGAESAKQEGFFVTLYAKETRWYAGESVEGWEPYQQPGTAEPVFSVELIGETDERRGAIARYGDVEVNLYLREDGSLGIQIDTPTDQPENELGPIGYVVMFNEADLYRNPHTA